MPFISEVMRTVCSLVGCSTPTSQSFARPGASQVLPKAVAVTLRTVSCKEVGPRKSSAVGWRPDGEPPVPRRALKTGHEQRRRRQLARLDRRNKYAKHSASTPKVSGHDLGGRSRGRFAHGAGIAARDASSRGEVDLVARRLDGLNRADTPTDLHERLAFPLVKVRADSVGEPLG